MSANDIQVGGDHYKVGYEHWDFVIDSGLDYILGNATKYVYRWRKKNGKQDLQKAQHYLQKALERNIAAPPIKMSLGPVIRLAEQMADPYDRATVGCIVFGDYRRALGIIERMLDDSVTLDALQGTPTLVKSD